VAQAVKALIPVLQGDLPEGVKVEVSSDFSVSSSARLPEVYKTLWEAAGAGRADDLSLSPRLAATLFHSGNSRVAHRHVRGDELAPASRSTR